MYYRTNNNIDRSITCMENSMHLIHYVFLIIFVTITNSCNAGLFDLIKSGDQYGILITLNMNSQTLYQANEEGLTLLEYAHKHGQKDIANALQSMLESNTALFTAVASKDIKSLEKMITEKPMLLSRKNADGLTPLLFAIRLQDNTMVQALLDIAKTLGEDRLLLYPINNIAGTETHPTTTPVHFASAEGNVGALRILLKYGASVEYENRDAPLYFAVFNGHNDAAEELLKNGANIDAKNHYDFTAVHYATLGGHESIVKMLINRGANFLIKTTDHCKTFPLATPLTLLENPPAEQALKYEIFKKENSIKKDAIIKILREAEEDQKKFAVLDTLLDKDDKGTGSDTENKIIENLDTFSFELQRRWAASIYNDSALPLHQAVRKKFEKLIAKLLDLTRDFPEIVNRHDFDKNIPLFLAVRRAVFASKTNKSDELEKLKRIIIMLKEAGAKTGEAVISLAKAYPEIKLAQDHPEIQTLLTSAPKADSPIIESLKLLQAKLIALRDLLSPIGQ